MTDRLFNALAQRAGALDASAGTPRWGTVTSVNAADYTAKVQLQPDGVLTGWLPVLSQSAGPGWGFICPPTVGQQVLVLPDLGDEEHGVILGGTWSLVDQAPQPATVPSGAATVVAPGDAALVHSTGSFLRFTGDGSAFFNIAGAVNVAAGGNATVMAAGYAAVLAPAIKLGAALTDTLRGLCTDLFRQLFNTHTHGGVQTGSGHTAVPDQQAGTNTITSIVTAE